MEIDDRIKMLQQEVGEVNQEIQREHTTPGTANGASSVGISVGRRTSIVLVTLLLILSVLLVFQTLNLTGYSVLETNPTPAETVSEVEQQVLDELGVEEVVPAERVGIEPIDLHTPVENVTLEPETTDTLTDDIVDEGVSEDGAGSELHLDLESPLNGSTVTNWVTFSYRVSDSTDVDRCVLYLRYRYVQDDFSAAATADEVIGGLNHLEIQDMQPGEYVWKVGCAGIGEEVFSAEQVFVAEETNFPVNLTVANVTPENTTVKMTPSNQTQNFTPVFRAVSRMSGLTEDIAQGPATVGEPVSWTKRLTVNRTGKVKFSTYLPKDAVNIGVQEITGYGKKTGQIKSKLKQSKFNITPHVFLTTEEPTSPAPEIQTPAITGFSAFDSASGDGLVTRFFRWLGSFVGITGAAVLEEQQPIELTKPEDDANVFRNLNLLYAVDRDFDSCELKLDGELVESDQLVIQGSNFFELVGLDVGQHTWQVVCIERNKEYVSESRLFDVKENIEETDEGLAAANESISGPIIPVSGEVVEVNITDDLVEAKVYEVSYETSAPEMTTEIISDLLKRVEISSDLHLVDIQASTDLPGEYPAEAVKLYWIVNGSRVPVLNLTYIDSDTDGLVEGIAWVVPHLSNQTYEVSIEILNVHSYPPFGGNWTVMFNTTGREDLTITPVDGTTFTEFLLDDNATVDDLEFVELTCGNDSLKSSLKLIDTEGHAHVYSSVKESDSLVIESLYVKNYECEDTGYLTNIERDWGKHYLLFDFGGMNATAENYVGAVNITLNSTYGTNYTNENLTVYYETVGDASVINITNWYLNGTSIMVLNMPFEANDGDNESSWTKDYSNLSNHGNVTDAVWNSTGGYDGQGSYEFDGVNDYISIDPVGVVRDEFSVGAWVKPDLPTEALNIFTTRTPTEYGFDMKLQNGTEIHGDIGDGTGWITISADATFNYQVGTWYHIFYVVNTTGYAIYANGDQVGSGTYSENSPLLFDDTHNIVIGRHSSWWECFNGTIDQVMVFNRSLSAEQVQLLYQNRTDIISFNETAVGDVWRACITPNDGTEDGVENCSNTLTVVDASDQVPPIVSGVVLNSTDNTNYTTENLTVWYTSSDVNGDNVTNVTNWYLNGTSIMVLNMPFEGTGGNESEWVKDYSNNSNHGSMTGSGNATWSATSGFDGRGAYTFDGTDDYIDAGSDSSFDVAEDGEVTVAAWVNSAYLPTDTDAQQSIIDKAGNTTHGAYFFKFMPSGGDTVLVFGSFDGVLHSAIWTLSGWSTDEWHHTAGTYDGTQWSLYVDGELKMNTTSDGPEYVPEGSMLIGARENTPDSDQLFNGTLDDIRVYNRSLTADQINLLWENHTDMIHSNETSVGDVWRACITPNDGTEDGVENCSNTLTVVDASDQVPPIVSGVVLNSTDNTNYTTENLTVWYTSSDVNGDNITNVTNWYLNGTSIMVLNMPFENWGSNSTHNASNLTRDYTNFSNDGNVYNAVWNSTGGYDGRGAYEFEVANVSISHNQQFNFTNRSFTIVHWTKASDANIWSGVAGQYANTDNYCTGWDDVQRFRLYIGNGSHNIYSVNRTIPLDEWVHFAAVYTFNDTPADRTIKLYVNGELNATYTDVAIPTITSSDFLIGMDGPGATSYFNGTIDEVKLFNRSLSAEQIAMLYANKTDVLHFNETSVGDVWQACVTPNDGIEDGLENCSSTLSVVALQSLSVTDVVLNSTLGTNYSNENLTVYWDVVGASGDVTNITNWYVNGTSIMVLNMPFEATGGNESEWVKDYSNNSNHGSMTGSGNATWNSTGGNDGWGAYEFDGVADFILLGDDASIMPTTAITITAWVNVRGDCPPGYCGIISKYDLGSLYGYLLHYRAPFNDFEVGLQTTGSGWDTVDSPMVNQNQWYHVAMTWNGTILKLFVDGEEKGTPATMTGTIDYDTATDITVGGYYRSSGNRSFNGTIADIRMYNISLTADQVLMLARNKTDSIHFNETAAGDVWRACVTPNDGIEDGLENCSNTLTVVDASDQVPPIVSGVVLNTTSGNNATNENLTLWYTSTDVNGDNITNVTDWIVDGETIFLTLAPFDGGSNDTWTRDYSDTLGYNLTAAATWNATGGHDGRGAYSFNGVDEYINLDDGTSSPIYDAQFTARTVGMWFKADIVTGTTHRVLYGEGGSYVGMNIYIYNSKIYAGAWSGSDDWEGTWLSFDITADEWHFVAVVFNGSQNRTTIFLDGQINTTTAVNATQVSSHTGNDGVGFSNGASKAHNQDLSSGQYFTGHIDQFMAFNRSLTYAQLNLTYQNRTDLMHPDETEVGEVWQACVVPNDGTEDGVENCSNTVTVTEAISCTDNDGDGFGAVGSEISACTYDNAYDCDDSNASLMPPGDDLNLSSDTMLCNGTYSIADTSNDGVINLDGREDVWDVEYSGTEPDVNFLVRDSSNDDYYPKLSYNSINETWLVVWYETDTEPNYVHYQRINTTGDQVGSMKTLTEAERNYTVPSVSYSPLSNQWLVVYENKLGGMKSTVGQLIYANGTAAGDDFGIIGTFDSYPQVSYNYRTHEWLVISYFTKTVARRVNTTGDLVGAESNVTEFTTAGTPALDYNGHSDEWVIVWTDNRNTNNTIYGQRVNSTGDLTGTNSSENFQISYTNETDAGPDVACSNRTGDCLVVWDEETGGTNYDVMGAVINSTGNVTMSRFLISNRSTNTGTHRPKVMYNYEADEWLVVYEGSHLGEWEDVYGQRVAANGTLLGTTFEENFPISNVSDVHQRYPELAYSDDSDKVLVVWTDFVLFDTNIRGQLLLYNQTVYGADAYTVTGNDTTIIGDNTGYGFYGEELFGVSVQGVTASNYSAAMYIGDGGYDSLLFNMTFANSTYGLYINSSDNDAVTNCTFFNNDYGVYIENSTDNLFYYNNFTSSSSYHAFADMSGNLFNTTNGSNCGAQCARGNFWDDVSGLFIFDSNSDGFGDSGSQYPYNSTYSSKVNENVTDYGPITDRGNTLPTVSDVVLNSTTSANYSNENLTVYWSVADGDGQNVTNVTNWYVDGVSIAVLSMPFEATGGNNESSWTRDYSNMSNHGTVYGATYSSTEGQDGFGAYVFDGENDYIDAGNDTSFDITDAISLTAWIKSDSEGFIVVKDPDAQTVILNGTQVLEDAIFDEDETRDGTEIQLIADLTEGTGEIPFIKFNISALLDASDVQNATICLYKDATSEASDEPLDIWYVANQTWDESEIDPLCNNSTVCDDVYDMFTTNITTYNGVDNQLGWDCIPGLESAVWTSVEAELSNLSFAFNHTGSDAADYYLWNTKEDADVAERPYLNVTYTPKDVPFAFSTMNGGEFMIRNNSVEYNLTIAGDLNDGAWHHVVATYDGTTMKIYVDGALNASSTNYSGPLPTNDEPTWIGRNWNPGNSTGYFNGTIGEVAIYNRSLSSVQVLLLHQNRTDILAANETSAEDEWMACVVPNDGIEDGLENCSNTVTVVESPEICANLTNPATWSGNLYNTSNNNRSFYVIDDVTLCTQTFTTDSIQTLFFMNGSYTLDCNNSVITGGGMGTAVSSFYNDSAVQNCEFVNFATGLRFLNMNDSGFSVGLNISRSWHPWHTVSRVEVDQDGNYLVLSYFGDDAFGAAVSKYSPSGELIWEWENASNFIVAYGLAVDVDGSMMVTGYNSRPSMTKLSSDGEVEWAYPYFGVSNDFAFHDAAVDLDGNYVVVGGAFDSDEYTLLVSKFAPDGTSFWNWSTPSLSNAAVISVAVDAEGNYILGGHHDNGGLGFDWRVIKMLPNSTIIDDWNLSITTGDDRFNRVRIDSMGNYILAGSYHNASINDPSWHVQKVTPSGTQIWNWSMYGTSPDGEWLGDIALDNEDNMILVGYSAGDTQFWRVSKLSSDGELMFAWTNYEGGTANMLHGVDIAPDGTIVLAGTHYAGILGDYKWRIMTLEPSLVPFSGVSITNVSLYASNTSTFLAMPEASATISNFTLGYNRTVGKINYPQALSDVNATLGTNRNILVDPYFVSLDSSDGDAEAFNASANITLMLGIANCSLEYYKAAGFPTSRISLLYSGSAVTPSYSTCTDGLATFTTYEAFSGYTILRTNDVPNVTSIVLNSTNGTNYGAENLTVYWTVYDADGDDVTNITNWYLNGTSIMVLNMPFEANDWNQSSWTKDYTNFSNQGTVSNATWNGTGGHDGWGAYEFDGSSSWINSSVAGDSVPNLTITLWFKSDDAGSIGNDYVAQRFVSQPYNSTNSRLALGINNDKLAAYWHDGGHNVQEGTTDLVAGVWYHAALVYNGSNISIYLNSTYENSWLESSMTAPSSDAFRIGRHVSTSRYFDGTLDEVRIYNRSLSVEQISLLYQNRTDMIHANETSLGDVWVACVTPNDGVEDGVENCSDTLSVTEFENTLPVVSDVVLNSTYGTNYTTENLTVYWNVSDGNGEDVYNVTNWYLNGTSIATLNMPFEATGGNNESSWTEDYTNFSSHTAVTSATWNSTGGYDGSGAYEFDGVDDYLNVTGNLDILNNVSGATISVWIKADFIPSEPTIANGDCIISVSTGNSTTRSRATIVVLNSTAVMVGGRSEDGESISYVISPPSVISTGAWYHVVGIVDYSNDMIYVYVNGAQVVSKSVGFTQERTNASDSLITAIGANDYTPQMLYNGTVDDVKVFKRVLSAEQVLALYENRTDLLVRQETSAGDVWKACVTPHDGVEAGVENCSNTLTVRAFAYDSVLLNSTFGTNLTTENLTVYWNVSGASGTVINITNWYVNGTSIAVLNMPFEATGGNESSWAKDYSDNSNHAYFINATWSSTGGYDGNGAYNFTEGIVEVEDSQELNITGELTISAWVKLDVYGSQKKIVGKQDDVAGGYKLSFHDNWKFEIEIRESDNTPCLNRLATGGTVIQSGQWYHVVGVYSDSEDRLTTYVNGEFDRENSTSCVLAPSASNLFIGREPFGSWPASFTGVIDDVKVYNRSLSAEQILLLYQNRTDMIHFNETEVGDVWQACVTPNDGTEDGAENCSNTLSVTELLNELPVASITELNSTYGTNYSNENLTVYWTVSDGDGDDVYNVTNWYLNGTSVMVLNMPFEAHDVNASDESVWARDYSNYSNNATTAGDPVWSGSSGFDGKGAYGFDGDDHLWISDSPSVNPSVITLEAWVYANESGTETVISKGGSAVSRIDYEVRIVAGQPWFGYYNGTAWNTVDSDTPVTGWNHIVATHDGSYQKLYVNGVLKNSTYMPYPLPDSDSYLYIGVYAWDGASNPFNGFIDAVRIWNRSLSAEQIQVLYQNRTDILHANETSVGDVWMACVVPNDGTEDGLENCSNTLSVTEFENTLPVASDVVLNSTYGTNYSTENLTVYWNVSDGDGDDVYNVTNWYLNGTSIMVLNMPFEATGGNESDWTKDYSGFNHHGSMTGSNNATWYSDSGHGGFGAYYFDGIDDHMDLGTSTSLQPANITVSFWVMRNDSWDNIDNLVMYAKADAVWNSNGWYLSIEDLGNENEAVAMVVDGSSGFRVIQDPNAFYPLNEWVHIAVTFNSGTDEKVIYKNGVSQSLDTFGTPSSITATGDEKYIGFNSPGYPLQNNFKGFMDDLRVYNRSLTLEQIQLLYQNRTDMISFNETEIGDVWQACVTPNDGVEDGVENCSN
ncbi:LamG-like jellyroll fold domain-containing protein, partial [Nanoarchaeota archaeon]